MNVPGLPQWGLGGGGCSLSGLGFVLFFPYVVVLYYLCRRNKVSVVDLGLDNNIREKIKQSLSHSDCNLPLPAPTEGGQERSYMYIYIYIPSTPHLTPPISFLACSGETSKDAMLPNFTFANSQPQNQIYKYLLAQSSEPTSYKQAVQVWEQPCCKGWDKYLL